MTGYRHFGCRISRATRPRCCRRSTSPPARWDRACPTAWASRWPAVSSITSPFRVWVLCGDSEMAEGSDVGGAGQGEPTISCRISLAIVDVNRPRPARTDRARLGSLGAYASRAHAFGARVLEVDGHDLTAVDEALSAATRPAGPTDGDSRPARSRAAGSRRSKIAKAGTGRHYPPGHGGSSDRRAGWREQPGRARTAPAYENLNGAGSAPEPSPALSAPSYARGEKVATRRAYGDAVTALGEQYVMAAAAAVASCWWCEASPSVVSCRRACPRLRRRAAPDRAWDPRRPHPRRGDEHP